MNRRMDRQKLNIGVYYLKPYARTEAHIKDLKDCGVDLVVCMTDDRPALDLFEKHGIGAILSGIVPSWWGGNEQNAGKMESKNPIDKYITAAQEFCDHPAVWGIDMGDEPSMLDFPHWGKASAIVEREFKNQFAYHNIFPSYGSSADISPERAAAQLGTEDYDQYIHAYCKNVLADYICFDFYVYTSDFGRFFADLQTVSHACSQYSRDMWCVLQVNSRTENAPMSQNMLRMQAFCAMAFGAKNIIWACYTKGWWHNNVLDEQGNKTPMYDRLKKVNSEIHTLAREYIKYDRLATHFTGFNGGHTCLDTTVFKNIQSSVPLVVGEMISHSKTSHALMICPADVSASPLSTPCEISFFTDKKIIAATSGSKDVPVYRNADGSCCIKTTACSGIFITAQ